MLSFHFSVSETSGEKRIKEFYTNEENIDLERFLSKGVIVDKEITDRYRLGITLEQLSHDFVRIFL